MEFLILIAAVLVIAGLIVTRGDVPAPPPRNLDLIDLSEVEWTWPR